MSEYYHVDNYASHIRVKTNAPRVLRQELKKLRYIKGITLLDYTDSPKQPEVKKPIIGVSGGVSDSYQQIEQEYQVTRRVLEVLAEAELPVFLLTKSNLVLRDIDLLEKINEKAFASVCFSITLNNEEVRRRLEPYSSSTEKRFNVLATLRKRGIKGGVIAMPIIPGIGDSLDNMWGLAREAKRVDAEFIIFAGMTLKPGRQKQHFMETIQRFHPDKLQSIKELYSNESPYGQPNFSKPHVDVTTLGYQICKEVGIKDTSVRHMCPGEFETNHKVLQMLLELKYYMTAHLGRPRNQWKKMHILAARIERGLPDLRIEYEEGALEELVGDKTLTSTVMEILDSGSCNLLEDIVRVIDEKAQTEIRQGVAIS
jgi:DNA repair photolyase